MNLSDNCAVCRASMLRQAVRRLQPCQHLFHYSCMEQIVAQPDATCPICRAVIVEHLSVERKVYKKYSDQDRSRIVSCANKGEDWVTLAASLNINYKTASTWVLSGRKERLQRGGYKKKTLKEGQIDRIIESLEENCTLTLKQLQSKVRQDFEIELSATTINNYLEGRLYTTKQVHTQPLTMNTAENKNKRANYVRQVTNFIQDGKQIVWIDQTNFNLFCRRTRGRSRAGTRAVQDVPASRGPNIHLIGGITAAGVVMIEKRRGSFSANSANEWVSRLLEQWTRTGNELSDLVVVCDNAPCHRRLEEIFVDSPAILLRLAPYSPMLNPIEIIWSKIKAYVKRTLGVPAVIPPGVVEQRLQYLEGIVEDAKNTVVGGDCARAVQHSSSFYPRALAVEDMPVGM